MTDAPYVRAKKAVPACLSSRQTIDDRKLRALSRLGKHQAMRFYGRTVREGYLRRTGTGSAAKYVLPDDGAATPEAIVVTHVDARQPV